MSLAIEKVALYAPIIASSIPFAIRRANRGIDAMDDNPFFGIANLVIAGGQTSKGIQAARDLAFPGAKTAITTTSNTIKGLSTHSKILQFIGEALNLTASNINPLICCASGIKILGSDDKADTAVREILGLGCMFGSENATKALIGMPIYRKAADGTKEVIQRTALYHKSPFLEKQLKAFDDLLKATSLYEKISASTVHGAMKGVIFVLASIAGYKIGCKIAELLLGSKEKQSTTCKCAKKVVMNTNTNTGTNTTQPIQYAGAA